MTYLKELVGQLHNDDDPRVQRLRETRRNHGIGAAVNHLCRCVLEDASSEEKNCVAQIDACLQWLQTNSGEPAAVESLWRTFAAEVLHAAPKASNDTKTVGDSEMFKPRERLWQASRTKINDTMFSLEFSTILRLATSQLGPRYRVYFPTGSEELPPSQAMTEPGHLFDCQVTLLTTDTAKELGGASVILAPWSRIRIQEQSLEDLAGSVKDIAHRVLGLENDVRFLLEVTHAWSPATQPLPTLDLRGESIQLAVLLAAWAGVNRRSLRPCVVTGTVRNGLIGRIEYVSQKYAAAVESNLGIELFLCPEPNATELRSVERPIVQPAPKKIDDLLLPSWTERILTDGLDRYRTAVRDAQETDFALPTACEPSHSSNSPDRESDGILSGFLDEDLLEYRSLASAWFAALDWPNLDQLPLRERLRICTVPFGEPTGKISRWFLWSWQQSAMQPGAAIKPGVLPILLQESTPDGQSGENSIGMEHAISALPLPVTGNRPLVYPDVLHNIVMRGIDVPIGFVVYGPSSLEVDYLKQQQRLEVLLRQMMATSPRAAWLFIASDLHHARFIESIVGDAVGN